MRSRYNKSQLFIYVIFIVLFTLFLNSAIPHDNNSPNILPLTKLPNNAFHPLQGNNATLDARTDALVYFPTQIMRVWANFTFENGSAIQGAAVGFLLRGPQLDVLATKANITDINGISTQSFLMGSSYYDGNYTMYVTAFKGLYNDSKTLFALVNASHLQISMNPLYLIGDIIKVYATYAFYNGTPIINALCGFVLRNATGPLQSKAAFTNSSGIAIQSFGTTNYAEGYYEMYVTVTKGNYTHAENQTFFISAYDGPIIKTPTLTPPLPSYSQYPMVNVSIGVPPAYAIITNAMVSYYNGTGWYNRTMTNTTNPDARGFAYYSGTIQPQAWNALISYKIWARDSLGNQTWNDNDGHYFNYTLRDPVVPLIGPPIQNDSSIAYNEAVEVMVLVLEPPLASGVQGVTLGYWTGAAWTNITMIRVSGTIYTGNWNATIPQQPYGTRVAYRIFARDIAGNTGVNDNGGNFFNYTIGDPYLPLIGPPIQNDTSITYLEAVQIMVQVTEPLVASGVQDVILSYWTGASWTNVTMVLVSGTPFNGNWNGTIPQQAYGTRVAYCIFAQDIASNTALNDNGGNFFNYTVIDPYLPLIGPPVQNDTSIAYTEAVQVMVQVTEPSVASGVQTVILSYWTGVWTNVTMVLVSGTIYAGNWNGTIPQQFYGFRLAYQLFARDFAGNTALNNNGGNYFNYTVTDPYVPSIGTPIQSRIIVDYTLPTQITVWVTEPVMASGVQTSILSYWTGAAWTNVTMIRSLGTIYAANWTAPISPLPYGTKVAYRIFARDFAGNTALNNNGGNYFNYTVTDPYVPSIGIPIQNDMNIDYTEAVQVMVQVTEPLLASGVQTAILSYWTGAAWTNITMVRVSGTPFNGNWNGTIPQQAYNTRVAYQLFARDFAGNTALNNNGGNFFNYTVIDPYVPLIGTPIQNDTSIAYTEAVQVMIQVTEPLLASGVQTVILGYWTGAAWTNITMMQVSGTIFTGNWNGTIPQQAYNTRVAYQLFARDFAGNTALNNNGGNYFNYTVTDPYVPSIGTPIQSRIIVDYTLPTQITVWVTEPVMASGVQTSILSYWTGAAWTNVTMIRSLGTIYAANWTAPISPLPYGTKVAYRIFARDFAGNTALNNNGGNYFNFTVTDPYVPSIGTPIQNDMNIDYTEAVQVMVQVTEPVMASGVLTAILSYWTGAAWTNVTMVRVSGTIFTGNWNGTIPQQFYGIRVAYQLFARDFAGNTALNNNGGNYFNYTVTDPYVPSIGTPIQNDTSIAYTEAVQVMVQVTEPVMASGVLTAILSYWTGSSWTNVTMVLIGGTIFAGNWNGTIPLQVYGTKVAYQIFARDVAGNTALNNNGGNFFNYTVRDPYVPIISIPVQNDTIITYLDAVKVMVQVTEPLEASGVQAVILGYWTGATWTNVTMVLVGGTIYSGNWNGTIPQQAYGTIVAYRIFAQDIAGNTGVNNNGGNFFNYTINDFWAPTISEIAANTPITYNKTAIITCRVQEPTTPANSAGVHTVILIYRFGAGWTNLTLMRSGGDAYNGQYYNFILPLPYGTTVQYWCWANDSAGNPSWDNNLGSYYTYTVTDLWGPNIGTPSQNDTVIEYTEAVNITVRVNEPTSPSNAAGVQTVILSYWNGVWTNRTMLRFSGTIYDGQYRAPIPKQPYSTKVAYKIYAQDIAGNWNLNSNNSRLFNYTVTDITAPTIGLTSPTNGTIIAGYVPFVIADIAAIDADVFNVTVVYRYNATPWNVHGTYLSGTNMTWSPGSVTTIFINLSAWIPSENYTIYVIAQDFRRLVSSPSYIYNIIVSNYTGPIIYSIIHSPTPPGYNESVVVNCTTFVPPLYGQIDTVLLHYYNGVSWNIVSMSNTTPIVIGQKTVFTGNIPQYSLNTKVSYWIFANDTNGNFTNANNYGTYYNYTVSDKWAPIISETNLQNAPINYDDTPNIICRVREPLGASGVNTVILRYNNGTGWFNVTMNRYSGNNYDGYYLGLIPRARYGTFIQYWILARDIAGNPRIDDNQSFYYSFIVNDFISPTISEINIQNAPIAYNMTANIVCRGIEPPDASGVSIVILHYNNGTGWFQRMMLLDSGTPFNGTYLGVIPKAPFGATVRFWIWANDSVGNIQINDNASSYYSYFVIDFMPPSAVANLTAIVYIGANAIRLSWSANTEPDLSHYQIHRSLTSSGFIPTPANNIANTTNIQFLDSTVVNGTQYFYIVVAVDRTNRISGFVRIVNGTPTNMISTGVLIQIYPNIHTRLIVQGADLILDFTATNGFQLMVNILIAYKTFPDHAILMSFSIDVTITGNPGTVTGYITLTLNSTLVATLGSTVDLNSFAIYYYDGASWVPLTSVYQAANHSITAVVMHFSVFAPFGTILKPAFPEWIIYVIIVGGVAGVAAIVVLAKRKKVVPVGRIIEQVNKRGRFQINQLAQELKIEGSMLIDTIFKAIQAHQISGFFADKKKEFITSEFLKRELNKILEGE